MIALPDDDRIVAAVLAGLREAAPQREPVAIWRHGSTVEGRERVESDVDVAVLLDPDGGALTSVERFDVSAVAARELGVEVDLADLRHGSTVLAARATALGRLVWTRDEDGRADALRYRCEVMSDYASLRASRVAVERRLEERFG